MRDAESMLDQLVAFCGEKITEADVLNVFGFTSEQTVADFTEKIFAPQPPAPSSFCTSNAKPAKT